MKTSQDERNIKTFGRNIKRLRKKEKTSQAQLAFECGLPANSIARIERGEVNTSISIAYRIAEAFDVQPGELFKK